MEWAQVVWGPILVALLLWVAKELRQLRIDLVTHMGKEEAERAADHMQRDERQSSTDRAMNDVVAEIHDLRNEFRGGLRTVHDRIDKVLS